MIKKLFGVAALTAFIFAAATPADARPPHAEKQIKASDIIWNDGKPQSTTDKILDRVFTEVEKVIIEDYYKGRRGDRQTQQRGGGRGKGRMAGSPPPGLAKQGKTPPGLAMQQNAGHLPPGLAKQGKIPPGLARQDLPEGLRGRLPTRDGLERVIVDGNVVLIDSATEIVLDILKGIASE
jgi:hypothetical protein